MIPTGRREDRIQDVCREIEAAGRVTMCHTADVGNRASIDALRDAVLKQFGRVDILLNAAGVTFKQPTLTVTEEQWSSLMDTDLTGVLRACQSFYEPLKASGRGRIINIASLGFVSRVLPGGRVLCGEVRGFVAHARARVRVGEGRNHGERHCARSVSHRTQ